jgi:hypothetical protein
MSTQMSQEFALAFLSSCFDAGLSKEAAAELLQKESVDQELYDRPAFAEGYLAVAAGVPGQMMPLRAGYEGVEKLASKAKGLKLVMESIINAFRGTGQAIGGGGKAVGTGLGKLNRSKTLHKYPFPSAVAAAAVGGGGAYGVNRWLNRDNYLMPTRMAPIIGPSGYSPQGYKDSYEAQLDSYLPNIYESNKAFGDQARRKELQEAVDSGKDIDGSAYLELSKRKRDYKVADKNRERQLESLEAARAENLALTDRIANRTSDLENQRTAWYTAPKRLFIRMTGQEPEKYYDKKISDLQSVRSAAQTEADLARDSQRAIFSGATKKVERKQPTSQEIQQKFFSQF